MKLEFEISTFKHKYDTTPINRVFTFDKLVERLTTFRKGSTKETAPGIMGGHFDGKGREDENLILKSILFLDLDHYIGSISDLEVLFRRDLDSYRWIAYSTNSYSPPTSKIRIALFLSSTVSCDEYRTISTNFINSLSQELQDTLDKPTTITPCRLVFLPFIPTDIKDYTSWYAVKTNGEDIDIEKFKGPSVSIVKSHSKEHEEIDPLKLAIINYPQPRNEQAILDSLDEYGKLIGYEEENWICVGRALHHQYQGKEEGLLIWDNWSKKDPEKDRYKGLRDIRTKWKSFKLGKEKLTTFYTIEAKIKAAQESQAKIHRPCWVHFNSKKLPRYTYANLKAILEFHKIKIWYDVSIETKFISLEGEIHPNINVALNKIKTICNNYSLPVTMVKDDIDTIAYEERINSWCELVRAIEWDGITRLQQFYETLEVLPKYQKGRDIYLRRWLFQMIHLTCSNDKEEPKSARRVLILQGERGIGKTEWVKKLAPSLVSEKYISTGMEVDFKDDMDVLACIKKVIVELGEFTALGKKQMKTFKNVISRSTDTLNRKFKPEHEEYRRRTVFIGTTNETDFLTDSATNDRFLVLPIIRANAYHGIDMQQLYAEVLIQVEKGEDGNLTAEELLILFEINEDFAPVCSIEEKFKQVFDMEYDRYKCTNLCTATQVLEALGININTMAHKKTLTNKIGKTLDKLKFRKNSKPRGWYLPPQRFDHNYI